MENMETNVERKPYQPKLGEGNRYENARGLNKELAEQINSEALQIVENAMSVLEKVRKDPQMKNFHDPKTDGVWMGEWLVSQKDKITRDLYGVVQLDNQIGIPTEVEDFVNDVYKTIQF